MVRRWPRCAGLWNLRACNRRHRPSSQRQTVCALVEEDSASGNRWNKVLMVLVRCVACC